MNANGREQDRFNKAFENHVPAYSPRESNNLCHNCGHEFDTNQWDERHIVTPGVLCESWNYMCPGCNHETITIGT